MNINLIPIKQHILSPWSCTITAKTDENWHTRTIKLSLAERVESIVVAFFSGLFSLGLGAIPSFYCTTALFKSHRIKKANKLADIKAKKLADIKANKLADIKANKLTAARSLVNTHLPRGHRIGIMNLGNTCWLNTALIFMTQTGMMDELKTPPSSLKKSNVLNEDDLLFEKIRSLLIKVHAILTEKKPVTELKGTMIELTKHIQQLYCQKNIRINKKNLRIPGDSLDADEFIKILRDGLKCDQKSYCCNRIYAYQPIGHKQPKSSNQAAPQYDLTLYTLWQKDNSELRYSLELDTDDLELTTEDDTGTNKLFNRKTYVTHAPDKLSISIMRVGQTMEGEFFRSHSPIQYGKDLSTTIIEYDPTTTQPKTRCEYRAQMAIIHEGELGGHYVAVERLDNETFILYDDSSVQRLSKEKGLDYFNRASKVYFKIEKRAKI